MKQHKTVKNGLSLIKKLFYISTEFKLGNIDVVNRELTKRKRPP